MNTRWISFYFVLAMTCSSLAQQAKPSVFGEEVILLPGQARAKMMLLRLPLPLASELLLKDDRQADYWDIALPTLIDSGKATVMERIVLEGRADQPLTNGGDTPQQTFLPGLHAEVTIEGGNAEHLLADWNLEWGDPKVERHHNGIGGVEQHRVMEVTANRRLCRSGQSVLLGAQTEHGGTSAIFALGLISSGKHELSEDLPSRIDAPTSTWLFTMPVDTFFQWQLLRTPLEEDLAAFHQWLTESANSTTTLVRLEAISCSSSLGITSLEQRWVAPVRFSPFIDAAGELKPKGIEDQRHSSGHSMETSDGSLEWSWPVTRERRESFSLGANKALQMRLQDSEGFFASATPSRDSPEVVRAWQGWDGRMRVLFARRRPDLPAPGKKPPAARSVHSLWCIESTADVPHDQPLRWADSPSTAEDLLAAVREGRATIIDSASSTCMSAYVGLEAHTTQGFLQLGKGLLLQQHPDGARLCPEILRSGHSLRTWSVDWQEKGSLNIHEQRSPPQWHDAGPILLPIQHRSLIKVSVDLPAHQPVIIASIRLGQANTRWWIAQRESIDPDPTRKSPPDPARFLQVQVIHRQSKAVVHEARLVVAEQIESAVMDLIHRSYLEEGQPTQPWSQWKLKEARTGLEFELSLSTWEATYHAPSDPKHPNSIIRHCFKGQQPNEGHLCSDEDDTYRIEIRMTR